MTHKCPVCESALSAAPITASGRDATRFSCPRCGTFLLTGTLIQDLPYTLSKIPDASAKLSHALRRAQEVNTDVMFSTHTIDEIFKRPLPSPKEQADLLIRWLANNIAGPGEMVNLASGTHAGVVGAKSPAGFALIVDHLFENGLLTGIPAKTNSDPGQAIATLSFAGWEYYEELAKGGAIYRKAFMAMKFGDATLDHVLETAFRPAVLETGFRLLKLDDVPKAGLIDDRLRVEIQGSDFLIADLTHENLGAYWEAGYAEGLGKPVIYTCERTKFDVTKTHFDTNHHLTVVWDADALQNAVTQLKATIRATLPHLAKQQDGN